MPFEDFRWVNEETVLSDRGGPREKRSLNHATLPGIVRKQCNSEIQNDTRNVTDDIEILHTDTLIKKVYICSLKKGHCLVVVLHLYLC